MCIILLIYILCLCFGATLSAVQGLLSVLCLEIYSTCAGYMVLGIESRLPRKPVRFLCKPELYCFVLCFWEDYPSVLGVLLLLTIQVQKCRTPSSTFNDVIMLFVSGSPFGLTSHTRLCPGSNNQVPVPECLYMCSSLLNSFLRQVVYLFIF